MSRKGVRLRGIPASGRRNAATTTAIAAIPALPAFTAAAWRRAAAPRATRDTASRWSSAAFPGITTGLWLRVLRDNGFAVDPPYWSRAIGVTLGSVPTTVTAAFERLRYGRRIRTTEVRAPLFILGIWRSGTTHLHNLLARDDRFAYPNHYEVTFPHTFLSTERRGADILARFLPASRPQDNVAVGVREPHEEEVALSSLTGRSTFLRLAFPRRTAQHDRYLTLRGLSDRELAEWKSSFVWFLKKLTFRYGRPLVLKSPGHTARIKALLELFPDAKFVHIRRNPYEVFQSALHTVRTLSPWYAMQRTSHRDLEGWTIEQYREAYDAFFEERPLIPEGRFHEIAFEHLEADPLGQVRGVYEALGLPDFGHVAPRLRSYLGSISGYGKNAFPDLSPALRRRIRESWRRCFAEWGYPE
jgi:hypothetical protein